MEVHLFFLHSVQIHRMVIIWFHACSLSGLHRETQDLNQIYFFFSFLRVGVGVGVGGRDACLERLDIRETT